MPSPADVAFGALLEAGRPDLAELVHVFTNDDGTFYIEPLDEVADPADVALIERAEFLINQVCAS